VEEAVKYVLLAAFVWLDKAAAEKIDTNVTEVT
jgi:hypothetical protein